MVGLHGDGAIDESLIRQFKSACSTSRPEPIDRFLPAEDDPNYMPTLEELVCLELEANWKSWCRSGRGTTTEPSDETIDAPPQLESYLRRFPQLNQPEILLRLIQRECSARQAYGQPGSIDEYRRRFPELEIDSERLASAISMLAGGGDAPLADTLALGSAGAAADQSTLPGRFGNYELLEEIGRGGMGLVYRARQLDANRIVALKVIRRDRLDMMPLDTQTTAVDRFRQEAQAAARLEHQHIVTVYEVGEVEGQAFFSMRYVEGRNLAEILQDGPIANRRAAKYMEPVSRAVHEAHCLGILHRDLKPQNIPVDSKTDLALVADFGLAKLTEGVEELTQAGEVMGTPQYMSPEQTKDSASVTAASDIYSLGATLYHILTGRPPFQAATPVETLRQVIDEEPAPPRQVNPSVDRDLDTICLKCLQKEPSRRYATAELLADDLRRYLNGEPILARPVGIVERTWRWCLRNPVVAALAALAATFLVLALVATSTGYVKTSAALAKSEKSHRQLEEGVDKFFGSVIDETLLNEPGMAPLRKKLLGYALPYYEQFLRDRANDPTIQDKLALAHYRVGKINELMDTPEKALVSYERAREIQDRLVDERPEDPDRLQALSDTLNAIGVTLHGKLKKLDEARKGYEEAVAVRERLVSAAPEVSEFRRKLANGHMNIGIIERESGRLDEAGNRLRQAQKIRVALLEKDPGDHQARRDLGMGYFHLANLAVFQQDYPRAEQSFTDAVATFEKSLDNNPKSLDDQAHLAACCGGLADLKCGENQWAACFDLYGRAAGLLKLLADKNPTVPKYRADLAGINMQIGMARRRQKQPQAAMKSFGQARDLLEKLIAQYPTVPEYRYNLAGTLSEMGGIELLAGRDDLDSGLALCQQAIELLKTLAADNPAVPDYRADLARIHMNLGMAEYQREHYDPAEQSLEQARGLLETLLDEYPGVPKYRADLAGTHMNLGMAKYQQKRLGEALKSVQHARDLLETLAEEYPSTAGYRYELTSALLTIARVQLTEGELQAASNTLKTARTHAANLVKHHTDNDLYRQRLATIGKGLASVTEKLQKKQ